MVDAADGPGGSSDIDIYDYAFNLEAEHKRLGLLQGGTRSSGKGASAAAKELSPRFYQLDYQLSLAAAQNSGTLSGNLQAVVLQTTGAVEYFFEKVDKYTVFGPGTLRSLIADTIGGSLKQNNMVAEYEILNSIFGELFVGFGMAPVDTSEPPAHVFARNVVDNLPYSVRTKLEKDPENMELFVKSLEIYGAQMAGKLKDVSAEERHRLLAKAGSRLAASIPSGVTVYPDKDGALHIEYRADNGDIVNLGDPAELAQKINSELGRPSRKKGEKDWPFSVEAIKVKSKGGPDVAADGSAPTAPTAPTPPTAPSTPPPGSLPPPGTGSGGGGPGGPTSPAAPVGGGPAAGDSDPDLPPTPDDTPIDGAKDPTKKSAPVKSPASKADAAAQADGTKTKKRLKAEPAGGMALMFREAGITPDQFLELLHLIGKEGKKESSLDPAAPEDSGSSYTMMIGDAGATFVPLSRDMFRDLLTALGQEEIDHKTVGPVINKFKDANNIAANFDAIADITNLTPKDIAAVINAPRPPGTAVGFHYDPTTRVLTKKGNGTSTRYSELDLDGSEPLFNNDGLKELATHWPNALIQLGVPKLLAVAQAEDLMPPGRQPQNVLDNIPKLINDIINQREPDKVLKKALAEMERAGILLPPDKSDKPETIAKYKEKNGAAFEELVKDNMPRLAAYKIIEQNIGNHRLTRAQDLDGMTKELAGDPALGLPRKPDLVLKVLAAAKKNDGLIARFENMGIPRDAVTEVLREAMVVPAGFARTEDTAAGIEAETPAQAAGRRTAEVTHVLSIVADAVSMGLIRPEQATEELRLCASNAAHLAIVDSATAARASSNAKPSAERQMLQAPLIDAALGSIIEGFRGGGVTMDVAPASGRKGPPPLTKPDRTPSGGKVF